MNFEDAKYIQSIGGQGIVKQHDVKPLRDSVKQIYEIMKDGNWHSIPELRQATKKDSAGRRLRELREAGISIEKKRENNSRLWKYRINSKTRQLSLLEAP